MLNALPTGDREMRLPAASVFGIGSAALILLPTVLLLAAGAGAAEPGLSDLGQGINAYNSRDFTAAVSHLRVARSVTPLSDYVAYHLGYSQTLTGDLDGALSVLTAYRANPVNSSPL